MGQVSKNKKPFDLSEKVKELEDTQRALANVLEDIATEKEQINAILENIADAVFVVDQNLNIILFNKAAERLSGFLTKEVKNKPFQKVLNFVFEESNLTSHGFIRSIFKSQQKKELHEKILLLRKDGSKIPVVKSGAPIRDEEGRVSGAVISFRDASRERKIEEAKDALKISNDRLSLATSGAKIGIWDWDIVNDVLIWDERMFALHGLTKSSNSLTYSKWKKMIHSEDLKLMDKAMDQALKGTINHHLSFRVIWPDKTVHFIRSVAMVKRNKEGGAVRMIGVNWDVTHEKEVDQMKTEFVSLVSHQLRTPLTSIKLFSEMLISQDFQNLSESQKKYLTNISISAQNMTRLVNDLLNVSRLESGRIAISPESRDVIEILSSVVREIKPVAKKNKVKLTFRPSRKKALKIPVDEILFREVFISLLSNAIRYCKKEKGEIILSFKKSKKGYIFLVQDNGIGIAKKDQLKIFKKFFRASNAVQKESDGSGLGLYTAKLIMKSCGGDLRFQSTLRKGSTFYVDLPLEGMSGKEGEKGIIHSS